MRAQLKLTAHTEVWFLKMKIDLGTILVDRYLYDLKIKCFCPADELLPAHDPRDPGRTYVRYAHYSQFSVEWKICCRVVLALALNMIYNFDQFVFGSHRGKV